MDEFTVLCEECCEEVRPRELSKCESCGRSICDHCMNGQYVCEDCQEEEQEGGE